MVVTEGDHFADVVQQRGLGITVPAGDVDALVAALESALFDSQVRVAAGDAFPAVRKDYEWSEVLAPLMAHVELLQKGELTPRAPRDVRYSPSRPRPPRFSIRDVGRGMERLFRGEFRSLARALRRKLRPRR